MSQYIKIDRLNMAGNVIDSIVFGQRKECLIPGEKEKEQLEDRNWDGGIVCTRKEEL